MSVRFSPAQATPPAVSGTGAFARVVDAGLAEPAARAGFRASPNQILVLRNDGDRLDVVVGVGERPDGFAIRAAAAVLARALEHCREIAIEVPEWDDVALSDATRAVVEGIALGSYRFSAHKSEPDPSRTEAVSLVHPDIDGVAAELSPAEAAIEAVELARDLANETPMRMTASRLADVAIARAVEPGLTVEVWDEERIVAERLGCLLAVNAGSTEPARVIRLDHVPADARAHIVMVGKGITFDSGGLSLKKPEWMYDMKGDMGGAAAVIAALVACARLAVGVRVTGIVMATDNLPGPGATKPGEIVTARNGTTVEILDTDAEGRLILADGLCLAAEMEPAAIIDVATLTGYGRVLGTHYTPVMSNNDVLANRIIDAASRAGERVWRLPLPDALDEALESPWADLRNIPDPDDAGTTAPGVFLRRFVGEIPWIHLDIGETGFASKTSGEVVRGCTGAMTRTLVEIARTWPS